MNLSSINVHIGEAKVSSGNYQLHTLLGSCIGIALLWPQRGVYGLAHCLLPQMPESDIKQKQEEFRHKSTRQKRTWRENDVTGVKLGEGRYVDQAINSLLDMMSITHFKDIRAVVAGGANMTRPDSDSPEKLVGHLNAQNAIKQLNAKRIIVLHEDTGGEVGRKLSICSETGDFDVKPIPRLAA